MKNLKYIWIAVFCFQIFTNCSDNATSSSIGNLEIFNIKLLINDDYKANLTWNTNFLSSSIVKYQMYYDPYFYTIEDTVQTINHNISLMNIELYKRYIFNVGSKTEESEIYSKDSVFVIKYMDYVGNIIEYPKGFSFSITKITLNDSLPEYDLYPLNNSGFTYAIVDCFISNNTHETKSPEIGWYWYIKTDDRWNEYNPYKIINHSINEQLQPAETKSDYLGIFIIPRMAKIESLILFNEFKDEILELYY